MSANIHIHSLVRQHGEGEKKTFRVVKEKKMCLRLCMCAENQKNWGWVVYQSDVVKNDKTCSKFSHHKPKQEKAQVIKMQTPRGPQRDGALLRDPTLDRTASEKHLQPCQLATGWQERVQLIKNLLIASIQNR